MPRNLALLSCLALCLLACGGEVEGQSQDAAAALTGSVGLVQGESPSVVADASGVLHVFARGANGALYQAVQNAAGWGTWQPMGISLLTRPAAALGIGGRIEVFGVGKDFALWHTAQTAANGTAWGPWQSLVGSVIHVPTVTRAYNGRLDVFVPCQKYGRGLFHLAEGSDGSFGPSIEIAQTLYSMSNVVAVTRPQDGRIELYVASKSTSEQYGVFEVVQAAYGSPSFSTAQLLVSSDSSFGVEAGQKGTDLIVFDSAHRELERFTESTLSPGSWSAAVALAPSAGSAPAVLEGLVFTQSPNEYLEEVTSSGTVDLGGVLTSAPVAALGSGQHISVFAQLSDHALWARSQTTATSGAIVWGPWASLGTP